MVEGGPWKGTEKKTDLVSASGDRIAADIVGLALIKSFGLWKDIPNNIWETRQIKRAVELGLGASKREEIKLVTASVGDNPNFTELIGKIRSII